MALGLPDPGHDLEQETACIASAVRLLLLDLLDPAYGYAAAVEQDADDMLTADWVCAELVLLTIGHRAGPRPRARALWDSLPDWEDEAPPPPPGTADRKSTRLNSSPYCASSMPSSACIK